MLFLSIFGGGVEGENEPLREKISGGKGGEMTLTLYVHMNKRKKKKRK
jgi:hypothetical protein